MGTPALAFEHDDMEMIDAYLTHLRKNKRCSPDTVALRRKTLTLLHRTLSRGIAETSQEELEDWLDGYAASPNTQATYWVGMRGFYRWAADPADRWIDEDPTAAMTPAHFQEGVARPADEEHLALVIEHGREPYRTWVILAAYQGLRCCEIAGLDREHVSRDTLLVVRGKGGRPRSHDTDPLVWDVVRALPRGPVARHHETGERATAAYVSKRANYYLEHELGLADVTMHMWRHRLGVQLQRQYKNIRVTQEALGHKSLTSTMIYTRADFDELRAARAMLPRPA